MSDISIRRGTEADATAICAVHKASVRGLCGQDYTAEQIEAWVGNRVPADYRAVMRRGEIYFVAISGNRVIGFGSRLDCEVSGIYIHPDFARLGVGRAILAALEQHARRARIQYLQLDSSLTAVPFYIVQGYAAIKEDHGVERQGETIAAVRMEETLG